jgi:calcineurin-like phosphoesterase family protein
VIWFTADWHWGHLNIIRHCNRPFDGLREMHECIIDNFVSAVRPKDKVYMLGDLAMSHHHVRGQLEYFLKSYAITYIRGNHDHRWIHKIADDNLRQDVHDLLTIRDNGNQIALCHYPMLSWPGSSRGSYHLHGHRHGTLAPGPRRLDVGVDNWHFRPVSIESVYEYMNGMAMRMGNTW